MKPIEAFINHLFRESLLLGLKFRRKRKSAIGLRVCRCAKPMVESLELWQRLGHASYRDWVLAAQRASTARQPAAVPPVGHQPRRRTHAAAPPNRSSTLGHHWLPTADRPDAFKDRCSTSLAVAHLRSDDHPAQPHGIVTTLKRWACGWEPYRLVWFQTASSIEACSDHV